MDNFLDLLNDSNNTGLVIFPEATEISCIEKANEEIDEFLQITRFHKINGGCSADIAIEAVDIILCIAQSAFRSGVDAHMLLDAMKLKVEKNKSRVWKKNSNGTYSHVK